MKKFIPLIIILFSPFIQAQTEEDKTVTLTVTGTGSTSDEAKENALRNAIEQAFGAFISSRTEILNDELISDQITSVSNGNIKSYEILNEFEIPTGGNTTTLKATVSVNKLTNFVESKGVSVEIKGGLFTSNIKQQILNEEAELNSLIDMMSVLNDVLQNAFDYIIILNEPISKDSESKNWEIQCEVKSKANKNMDFCSDYLLRTLISVGMSSSEVSNYSKLNKLTYPIKIKYNGVENIVFLRNPSSIKLLQTLKFDFIACTMLFKVRTDLAEIIGFEKFENASNSEKEIKMLLEGNTFNLFNSETIVGVFKWTEKRTLSQIQEITEFKVESRDKITTFRTGGYHLNLSNGKVLIVCPFDLGESDSTDAQLKCDEFILSGINIWQLPMEEDLLLISKHLQKEGFGFIPEVGYWCRNSNNEIVVFDFFVGKVVEDYDGPYGQKPLVMPVARM